MDPTGLIPKHGGYRNLTTFMLAQAVYDLTVIFTNKFISRFSRTRDQMVQAARSGTQNIAEGSQASGTSKKSEIFLTNVARASLEELRLDYQDYLRQNGLPLWDRHDPRRTNAINSRLNTTNQIRTYINDLIRTTNGNHGEIAANIILVYIAVATGLLERQLAAQSKSFLEEGGFTERMHKMRRERR